MKLEMKTTIQYYQRSCKSISTIISKIGKYEYCACEEILPSDLNRTIE